MVPLWTENKLECPQLTSTFNVGFDENEDRPKLLCEENVNEILNRTHPLPQTPYLC